MAVWGHGPSCRHLGCAAALPRNLTRVQPGGGSHMDHLPTFILDQRTGRFIARERDRNVRRGILETPAPSASDVCPADRLRIEVRPQPRGLGHDGFERSRADCFADENISHASNPTPGNGQPQRGLAAVDQNAACNVNPAHASIAVVEQPAMWGGNDAKDDAIVVAELFRRQRRTAARQIFRRCIEASSNFGDLPRDQRRVFNRTGSYSDIGTFHHRSTTRSVSASSRSTSG
jgi:hypothetical protein